MPLNPAQQANALISQATGQVNYTYTPSQNMQRIENAYRDNQQITTPTVSYLTSQERVSVGLPAQRPVITQMAWQQSIPQVLQQARQNYVEPVQIQVQEQQPFMQKVIKNYGDWGKLGLTTVTNLNTAKNKLMDNYYYRSTVENKPLKLTAEEYNNPEKYIQESRSRQEGYYKNYISAVEKDGQYSPAAVSFDYGMRKEAEIQKELQTRGSGVEVQRKYSENVDFRPVKFSGAASIFNYNQGIGILLGLGKGAMQSIEQTERIRSEVKSGVIDYDKLM